MRANLILGILALLLVYPTWRAYEQDKVAFTDYAEVPKLFDGFTPENIGVIAISVPQRDESGALVRNEQGDLQRDALQIVRRGTDEWAVGQVVGAGAKIQGVAIRADRVRENVMQHLQGIRLDEKALVQKDADADALEGFGLDEENAVVIQAANLQGAPMAELLIGKDVAEGRSGSDVVRGFYVRRKDSSDVVLYEQPFWGISADPDRWVDRMPLRIDPTQVTKLSLLNEIGKMAVYRERAGSGDWKVGEAPKEKVGAVKSSEITTLVRGLTVMNIQSYVEPLPQANAALKGVLSKYGLLEPRLRIAVTLADETEYVIEVGKQVPGTNEYYFRISTVNYLMTVGDWVVTQYETAPDFYFGPHESEVVRDR